CVMSSTSRSAAPVAPWPWIAPACATPPGGAMRPWRWRGGSRSWPARIRDTATDGSGRCCGGGGGRATRKGAPPAGSRRGRSVAGPRHAPRRRRPHGQDINGCHLRPSRGKDDVWTWDFLFDRTSDGRSLKWLSLVDEFTRECLSLEARRGMTADEIREILAGVVARRG